MAVVCSRHSARSCWQSAPRQAHCAMPLLPQLAQSSPHLQLQGHHLPWPTLATASAQHQPSLLQRLRAPRPMPPFHLLPPHLHIALGRAQSSTSPLVTGIVAAGVAPGPRAAAGGCVAGGGHPLVATMATPAVAMAAAAVHADRVAPPAHQQSGLGGGGPNCSSGGPAEGVVDAGDSTPGA